MNNEDDLLVRETHTRTQTHIYAYVYVCVRMCVYTYAYTPTTPTHTPTYTQCIYIDEGRRAEYETLPGLQPSRPSRGRPDKPRCYRLSCAEGAPGSRRMGFGLFRISLMNVNCTKRPLCRVQGGGCCRGPPSASNSVFGPSVCGRQRQQLSELRPFSSLDSGLSRHQLWRRLTAWPLPCFLRLEFFPHFTFSSAVGFGKAF